jgi:hypothetical protein
VEIPVPREKHGVLIGKGGGMKEEIQMECRTYRRCLFIDS